jgi:hypothetical protein
MSSNMRLVPAIYEIYFTNFPNLKIREKVCLAKILSPSSNNNETL